MLVSSYVLLTPVAGRCRCAGTYVVISLIASTFFVVALALIYATGTVNMAELAAHAGASHGVRPVSRC